MARSKSNTVIVYAKRTPIGKRNGIFKNFKAHELGGMLIKSGWRLRRNFAGARGPRLAGNRRPLRHDLFMPCPRRRTGSGDQTNVITKPRYAIPRFFRRAELLSQFFIYIRKFSVQII